MCSEGNLNIKIRMPFVKARTILPRPMFDPAFPMVSKVAPCKLLAIKNLKRSCLQCSSCFAADPFKTTLSDHINT